MKSIFALLVSAVVSIVAFAGAAEYHDELYDDQGSLRQQYAKILPYLEKKSSAEQKQYLERSFKAFNGENEAHTIPRIIPAEFKEKFIDPGISQRAKALVAFLKDHYSGKKSYSKIIDPALVEKIIARNGEAGYAGLVNPEDITFFYGPDMIVDADGVWRVIEDNTGFIGGPADVQVLRELTMSRDKKIGKMLNVEDPEVFYRQLTDHYKAIAKENGGKVIYLDSQIMSDNEDMLVKKMLTKYGIEIVDPDLNGTRLKINKRGVYTVTGFGEDKVKEKVGYVIVHGEHAWMDQSHRASRDRYMYEEARELLSPDAKLNKAWTPKKLKALRRIVQGPRTSKTTAKIEELIEAVEPDSKIFRFIDQSGELTAGINKSILKGRVAANYTPGTDFINDKQFYIFVEDLIRFYLKEEPILRNIPSGSFGGRDGKVDKEKLDAVLANFNNFVIKRVDGRGGDAVWVGPKTAKEELPALRKRVEADPTLFIFQSYSRLSQMQNWIIDSRGISFVHNFNVLVSNMMWGRATPEKGNGKVNVSGGGRELPTLTLKSQASICRDFFAPPGMVTE